MVRFVVMASGQATRMGQDKLILPWKDSTVLGYVLKVILQSLEATRSGAKLNCISEVAEPPAEVWVVARKPMRDYGISANWSAGDRYKGVWINQPALRPLAETISLGLADLPEGILGICFVPGDQVGLEPQKLGELTQCFLEKQPDFLVPQVENVGINASPVFFHRRYLEELRSLQGEQGGRAILQRYPQRWLSYSVPAEFMEDVDTLEDYQRLRAL
ncbi:nucleotidyltransferase family protein [Desulfitobacterium sp.]|uniref:nucleotidyltransferase family protein n=1 Tax=Desulfitobacterium sp. TaxID=49981 RepID=UPI002B6A7FA0|nr:NTP transferase domain-containing protein [Desulfitobacterium sp.]HVJ49640.1 NTP transferase domain-containing protein [Desulfitobacterium sp.]